MASGPITSWQMGKKWKRWQTIFSWAPKSLRMVTAATKLKDACSLEEKLWQTQDSILKSRDITLPTKVCIAKAVVFPVVMYECESWTTKKAESWRIDTFKLWCWRTLLRVPWTARRSNQSILKEINPECLLEDCCWSWSSNTLATWCKELNHWKRPWCWGRLRARREGSNRGWDGWMASLTQWTWVWTNSGRQWQGRLACCSPWGHKESDPT